MRKNKMIRKLSVMIKFMPVLAVMILLSFTLPTEVMAENTEVTVNTWADLVDAIEKNTNITKIYLGNDFTVGSGSTLRPNHNIIIDGQGHTVIDAGSYAAFDLVTPYSLTLLNLTLTSDQNTSATSALITAASGSILKMTNCTITDGTTGGLDIRGKAILKDCAFYNNIYTGSSSTTGGALTITGDNVVMDGCSVVANSSTSSSQGQGGGVNISGSGKLYANNCVFANNVSGTQGGGFCITGGNAYANLINCTIAGNASSRNSYGDGVHIYSSGNFRVANCLIVSNYAMSDGTVHNIDGGITIVGSITGNDYNSDIASSYVTESVTAAGNTKSISRPELSLKEGMAHGYYIPVSSMGSAASGGVKTYFYYDDAAENIYMGYGDDNSLLASAGNPNTTDEVTTFFEGYTRVAGIIGASGFPYPTVVFDSNGGSAVESQRMVTDEVVVTEPDTPAKEGYTFAGWFSDADLTQAYVFGNHENASITLYAKWIITDPVAVTFDANGGTGTMVSQQVPRSVATKLNPMSGFKGDVTKPVFTGWNTKDDGSGESYADGANITAAANVTLYAQWVALQDTESYTVTDLPNMVVTLTSATPDNLKAALASPAREVIVPAAISLTAGEYDGSSETYGKANAVVTLNASYGITVAASNEVQMKNLKIRSASGYSTGTSKITNNGTLSMEECTVSGDGGGINNASGKTAIIKKCDFYQNVFSGIGSAINNAGTLVVDECSFKENVASGEGSIYNSGTIYVNNSIFADNGAGDYTGGIMHQGTAAYLTNCTFTGNVHAYNRNGSGGGITVWSGPLTAVNCIILDNYINGVTTQRDAGRNGGTLNLINCLTGGNLYSVSSETNPKTDTTHSTFIGYVDTPVRTSYINATTTVSPHRSTTVEMETESGRYLRYAPTSGGGPAATGGVDTYFHYDDNGTNITLGYGSGSSITSLVGTATSDMKVDKYYEGTSRVSGVIGASAASPAVVFNSNGGKGSKGAQLYTKGVAFALSPFDNAFHRTGYTFAGWATSPNGTVAYSDGGSATFTADVTTLYAAWTPAKYGITYNAGDGSGSMFGSNNLDYGSIVTLKSNSFSGPSGKVFAGWLDADGRYYSNNTRITVTGDMNLTAQWGTPVSDFSNLTAGIYVLTQDVTVSAAVAIPDGVTICGDGHTVSVEHPYVREDGTVRTAAYNATSVPDGYSNYNVFTVTDSDTSDSAPVIVGLRNMTIIGGYNTNGAVYNNAGKISLQDVTITRSSRGLLNNNGIALMKRCDISGNAGANTGVGVGSAGANSVMVIDGCSFTDNRYTTGSNTDGGSAIYIAAGRGYANNSVIANNTSNGAVGAVTAGNDLFYMANCTITGNILLHSNRYGAGLKNNIYATNCIVADNYYISTDGALESCDNSQTTAGNLNKYLLNSLSNIKGTPVEGVESIGARRDTGSLPTGTTATLSTAFPHPAMVSDSTATGTLRYVPVKSDGTAANGGVSTYFYYPADIGLISTSTVTMGYGENPVAIGNAALDDGTHEVQTYYEGGARSASVYGASGAADGICHVGLVEAEGGSVKGIQSWGEYCTSGTQVSVEAVADTYYEFAGWTASGITLSDAQKASPALTFTVNSDVTLTPTFEFTATEVTVSTLDELEDALSRTSVETVYVSNVIPLTAGTDLNGNGKTVRVPVPYVNEDGTVNENASNWGVFNAAGVTATIKNMIIVGGKAAAIQENMDSNHNGSNLSIENVKVTRASCAISDNCSFLYMKNSILTKNIGTNSSAISVGAGWYSSAATIVMDNCSVVDNRSTTGGAVVCICGSGANSGTHNFYANNSVFANNTAINTCAGIYVAKSGNVWAKAYLTNCTIAGNKLENASGQGAGINVGANGEVSAVNCIIADNYDKDGKQSNVEGTISPKIANYIMDNGGIDTSGFAASYDSNGIPVLTEGAYVIANANGPAASGGTKTYFSVSGTTVKMGYDVPDGAQSQNLLGNGTTDASVVTGYYEGGERSARDPIVIGASGAILKDCTVIFDSNGGTTVADQTVKQGALVAKPADPTKSGAGFAGWYKDSSLTQPFDFSSDRATCDANDSMTLYAKWATALTPAMVTIPSVEYTGAAIIPMVTVKDGTTTLTADTDYTVVVNPDSDGNAQDCINVGDYTVRVTGKDNYASTVDATFTISPKAVTVSANNISKAYGSDDPEFTAAVEGTLGSDTVTYTLSREAGENVKYTEGQISGYAITPTGDNEQGNYSVTYVSGVFTINPKEVTLAWSPDSFEYSGEPQVPAATAGGLIEGDTCEVTVSVAGDHTDANEGGTPYTATATGLSNGNYKLPETGLTKEYTITRVADPAAFTTPVSVSKGGHSISLAPAGAVGTVTYAFKEGSGYGTLNETTGEFTSGDSLGTAVVTATIAQTTNYNGRTVDITVNIVDKITDTMTVTQEGITYGGILPDPSFSVSNGTVTSKRYTGTLRSGGSYAESDSAPAEAGSYTVTVTYETDTTIYTGSTSFTILPANISGADITLGSPLTYNGSSQTQNVTAVTLNGSDITSYCTISGNTGTNAGSYTLTVTADTASNYMGSVSKAFTIERKSVTVSISVTGTYKFTGSPITPTVTVNVNGVSLAEGTDYSISAANNVNAGTATVKVTSTGGNYTFTEQSAEFTIGKADALTLGDIVLEQEKTRTGISASVSQAIPDNAGTLTYSAGIAVVRGSAKVTSFTVDASGSVSAVFEDGEKDDVITLPVLISSPNYEDSTCRLIITLTEKPRKEINVVIAEGSTLTRKVGDNPFTLHTRLSGNETTDGTFTWASTDTSVATVDVSSGLVVINGAGETEIKVIYESDSEYGAAKFVLTVKAKPEHSFLKLYEKVSGSLRTCEDKELAIGKTFILVPEFEDGTVANERVAWISTNPDVATVTQDGKVTARSVGHTIIRAVSEEDELIEAECSVTVFEAVSDIILDSKSITIGVGENAVISATVIPGSGIKPLKWTVEGSAVDMTVSSDERSVTVKGVNKGKSMITALATDGSGKYASCLVSVGDPVGDFAISGKDGVKILPVGKSLNINPDWQGPVPENPGLKWKVEAAEGGTSGCAAVISSDGVLTGLSEGTVRVTAISVANSEKTATTDIQIYVPVKSASLNTTSGTVSTKEGANGLQLNVILKSAAEGLRATGPVIGSGPMVKWSVDEQYSDQLAVDAETGLVKAGKKAGKTVPVKAEVTAFNGYKKVLYCKVKVAESNELKGIKIDRSRVTLGAGSTLVLNASLNPLNPDGPEGMKWSSSDEKVVSVDQSGTITGISPGTAEVTVTADGTVKKMGAYVHPSTTCRVTVTPGVTSVSFTNADKITIGGLAVGSSYMLKTKYVSSVEGRSAKVDLVWSSSDPTVATVKGSGYIKAVGPGTVTVKAISSEVRQDGRPVEDSVTFMVYEPVKKMTLDKKKLVIGTMEGSRYGTVRVASVTPESAYCTELIWKVNNDKVRITPNEDGSILSIEALKPGVAKLTGYTVRDSKKRVYCTVTVRGSITDLKLEESKGSKGYSNVTKTGEGSYISTMKPGKSMKIKPVLEIDGAPDGTSAYKTYKNYTDTSVSYRSSNISVATVTNNGRVKINPKAAVGSTAVIYITSADGRKTVGLTVTVKK